MPSAADYGLLLPFIVTKIVTSVFSGAVTFGALECCGGFTFPRFPRCFVGRCYRLLASSPGPHDPAPPPAREPPIRESQWSPRALLVRSETCWSTLRYLPPTAPRLHDDRSGPDQKPTNSSWRRAERFGSQARALGDQRAAGHSAPAGRPVAPTPLDETRLADLIEPGSSIIRFGLPDCASCNNVEADAVSVAEKLIMAIDHTARSALLRGDRPHRGPHRFASAAPAAEIAARNRPLRLAHLQDELPEATHFHPLEVPRCAIRIRLHPAARLPISGLEAPRVRSQGLPEASPIAGGIRPPSLPFSAPRLRPSR